MRCIESLITGPESLIVESLIIESLIFESLIFEPLMNFNANSDSLISRFEEARCGRSGIQ